MAMGDNEQTRRKDMEEINTTINHINISTKIEHFPSVSRPVVLRCILVEKTSAFDRHRF
jgi:hypothetical protein